MIVKEEVACKTHFHQFEKILKIVKLVHSDLTALLDHSIVHNF